MLICSSKLIAILLALLAFVSECVCATPSSLNSSSPVSSTLDDTSISNTSSGNDLFTSQTDGHLASDNKTETPSISVAQLSVGNRTVLAISSGNSSNATVGEDSNIKSNGTVEGHKKPINFFHNKGAMLRAFYVAVGILVIITIYTFVLSRLKKRKTKRHMYGLLTKHTDVELTPLGQDEDEEEHTVFDAVHYKS